MKDPLLGNKIAGAVLFAALLALGLRAIAETLYHPHPLDEPAYRIAVAEAGSQGPVEAAAPIDPAVLIATANVSAGQRLMARCASCHSFDKGGADKQGPNLYGVLGRVAGSKSDFSYTGAMQAYGQQWSYDNLFAYLENSSGYIQGTTMIQRVRNPDDRAAMIAFLRCQNDNPLPLPETPEGVEATATCPN